MKFSFKNIFPTKQITYTTHLSKEEVLARVKKEIEPTYLHSSGPKRYVGRINGNTFLLKKVPVRSTSLLAVMSATVISEESTKINLTVTLPLGIRVFSVFGLLFCAYTLITTLIICFFDPKLIPVFLAANVIFPTAILFFYRRVNSAFKEEIAEANINLKVLFETEQI